MIAIFVLEARVKLVLSSKGPTLLPNPLLPASGAVVPSWPATNVAPELLLMEENVTAVPLTL